MKLKDWLKEKRISQNEFSQLAGISTSRLSNYVNGKRKPSLETIEKIHFATKGKVRAEDFYG